MPAKPHYGRASASVTARRHRRAEALRQQKAHHAKYFTVGYNKFGPRNYYKSDAPPYQAVFPHLAERTARIQRAGIKEAQYAQLHNLRADRLRQRDFFHKSDKAPYRNKAHALFVSLFGHENKMGGFRSYWKKFRYDKKMF